MKASKALPCLAALFCLPLNLLLHGSLLAYGGNPPSGLPTSFGFGVDDKYDSYAPAGPHMWKDGQGTSCWDYSYAYLTPGWLTWVSGDPNWAGRELMHWEAAGQVQVFTYYYSYGSTAWFKTASNMNGYWSDLKVLFQQIASHSTKKVIVHFEPDGIGFWRQGNASVTASGNVIVGSATAPDPTVGGLAWNTTNFPDTIQGWNKAIYFMRQQYAPTKALLAHHYTHWATGTDVLVGNVAQGAIDTAVDDMCNYIKTIENGYAFDLVFGDPSDRDADWWRKCQGTNDRWTDPNLAATSGARSFGKLGYVIDRVSFDLGRRTFLWQIPNGNTYFKTCNNSDGHFRDNSAQCFLPSTTSDGSAGTPGDAYSSSDGTKGPLWWANHGVMGILFGSGYYGGPVDSNGGSCGTTSNLTHVRDYKADGTTNPGSDANAGGPSFDVWGKATSANSDDDGGYIRLAVAKYCSLGKAPLPGIGSPTPTPTYNNNTPTRTPTPSPTPADCPLLFNSCEAASTNGTWGGANATQTLYTGSNGSVTQGLSSIKVAITTPSSFNDQAAQLTGFTPGNWTRFDRITLDVWVDPAALLWTAASTYHQMSFRVDCGAGAGLQYEVDPTGTGVAGSGQSLPLVAGMNHLTFNLNWTANALDPSSVVKMYLCPNLQLGNLNAGAFYVDNVVLHTDTVCPPPSPTPTISPTSTPVFDCPLILNTCDSLTSNGNWNAPAAGWSYNSQITLSTSTGVTTGGGAVKVAVTATASFNDRAAVLSAFVPSDWTAYKRVSMDIYVEPTALLWTAGSGYHSLSIRLDNGSSYEFDPTGTLQTIPLNAGANQVTFTFNWGANNPAGITKFYVVPNLDPLAMQPGVFYIDNVVLHSDAVCPPSPTATPVVSATSSATRTLTPSPSGSPTRSATASPSLSSTPQQNTATLTASPTPGNPSFTPTPSASPTPGLPTATGTPTASPSPTRSATLTASPVNTATATPTSTISIYSATSTPSFPATRTNSASPSPSQTFSQTATPTASPTFNPFTPTWTPAVLPASATSTSTATPQSSAVPTATPTPPLAAGTDTSTPTLVATPSSPTLSATLTVTLVPSQTATGTAVSPALSATLSATAPGAAGGPVRVISGYGVPNPNAREISVNLTAATRGLSLRLYTRAMLCLKAWQSGPLPAAWNPGGSLPLDLKAMGLANGAYYLLITPSEPGSPEKLVKLEVLK